MVRSIAIGVQSQSRNRALMPICLGAFTYLLFLNLGERLLWHSDMHWHIAIGQWIIDNRAMPYSDIYSFTRVGEPWTSSSWLSEVLYAATYSAYGWGGPVILTSLAIGAMIAIYVYLLTPHFGQARSILLAMLALLMSMHQFVARPDVLALPVMITFAGGLMAAADRQSAPSWWLVPLMPIWISLHGSFILGVALIGPIGLEALWEAKREQRLNLAMRWTLFGVAALVATCATPYGWHSPLGALNILGLGKLLAIVAEWKPADFSSFTFFEGALLGLIGLAFYRGLVLSPPRILLLLGLIWMALTHNRYVEVFGFLAPLVVAKPLAGQLGLAGSTATRQSQEHSSAYVTVLAVLTLAVAGSTSTISYLAHHTFTFGPARTLAAPIDMLKQRHVTRIFNRPEFGGFLISYGMKPFVDGRLELYGENFVMSYARAIGGHHIDELLHILDEYNIEATLLSDDLPASKILDHIPGWKRIYTDDQFVVHIRENLRQASAGAAVETPDELATPPAPAALQLRDTLAAH